MISELVLVSFRLLLGISTAQLRGELGGLLLSLLSLFQTVIPLNFSTFLHFFGPKNILYLYIYPLFGTVNGLQRSFTLPSPLLLLLLLLLSQQIYQRQATIYKVGKVLVHNSLKRRKQYTFSVIEEKVASKSEQPVISRTGASVFRTVLESVGKCWG